VVVRKYERAARRRQGSLRLLDLPQRLKPIPKRSGYRSAEALRHPKSAASKICCFQNLLPAKSAGLQNQGGIEFSLTLPKTILPSPANA
jgi:hypothetical protein